MTCSEVEGDELTQMVCERALSRLHLWQEGTRLDSWLYKIAQNLWINRMHQEKTRNTVADMDQLATIAGGDTRKEVEMRNLYGKTVAALRELPHNQREVLILVCVEGFSYKEAAETLDLKVGTVMSRLSRARIRLWEMVHGETATSRQSHEGSR